MKLTIEISMYPFQQDYKPPILAFIERLNAYPGLRVQTSATSTLVSGDYDTIMNMLHELLAWSHATLGKAVFVTKFIPGHEPD